ncbi:MAG: pilus assembly protein PilP [Desulfobacterales bacterium]|jgi:type IV pilus assembly protein PilP
MGNKNLRYSEISDEFMNSLRDAYNVEINPGAEECPMSEISISYAAQELDIEAHQNFRYHLHTCRFCLDLVLDVKVAEAESEAKDGQPSKVLPALSKAIKTPRNSSQPNFRLKGLKELFAKYCFPLLSPKFVGGFAAACLAFIIINFGLNDPEVSEKLQETNKKIAPKENIAKHDPKPKSGLTSRQDSKEKHLIKKELNKIVPYDGRGKMDPFEPMFREKPVIAKKKINKKRIPRTPLERIALSQLKLVGIMLSENGNKAILEDSSGKGYVVSKGTYIGTNSGKVIRINKDRIVIEEEFEDVFGKTKLRQREIKLPKPPSQ